MRGHHLENPDNDTHPRSDDGLTALIFILRSQGVSVLPEQIQHQFPGRPIGVSEMIRCAKGLGLKARSVTTSWERLARTPLPVIAAMRDGSFLVLGRCGEDQILVQAPNAPRPSVMSRAELEAIWDGRLVLMTKRATLTDLARRFDITWFMGAIHKYRWLLGEVLIASFFLQFFGLISPLFFQVVIDKVLVHRSMSTLDVLVIG
ncbi:cysteine peptidase family C39 domain-containing protein, partial [Bosea sp. TAB14]